MAYALLALFFTRSGVLHPTSVSYLGHDSLLFLWNFWWTKFSIFELGRSPLFTDYIYWPNGTSLAMHSFVLPYGLLSVPFQFLFGDLAGCAVAANLISLASLALSAWIMYALALRLTSHRGAAFAAGLIFAFFPFRLMQLHLLHVFCIEFIALWALALFGLLERPALRTGLTLGACSALLVYASQEYALYALLLGALCLAPALLRRQTRSGRARLLRALGVALASAVVLSLPILVPVAAGRTGGESAAGFPDEAASKSPALAALLLPNTLHPLWGRAIVPLRERLGTYAGGMRPEASIGCVALALAVLGALRGPRRSVTVWWAAALMFLVLALGPELRLTGNLHIAVALPYAALYRIMPFFRQARDPLRVLPLLMLALAVLAAFGLKWLAEKAKARARWLPVGVCTLILLEYVPPRLPVGPFPVPEFYQQIARDPEDYALLDVCLVEKVKLYNQIVHRKRIVNQSLTPVPRASKGALSFVDDNPSIRLMLQPLAFLDLPPGPRSEAVALNRRLLRDASIRYVVVHVRSYRLQGNYWEGVRLERTPMKPETLEAFDRVLKAHGAVAAYRDADIAAYRF